MKDSVLHSGFLTLVERTGLDKKGKEIKREIVKMDDAVAAFVFHNEKVLLVKQPRFAKKIVDQEGFCKINPKTWENPNDEYVWEIPAGMLDIEGENELDCILREINEEAGLHIDQNDKDVEINLITTYFPALGHCDHKLSIYSISLLDEKATYNIDSSEDVDVSEVAWVDFNHIENMIKKGEIVDGKTILSYWWSCCNI